VGLCLVVGLSLIGCGPRVDPRLVAAMTVRQNLAPDYRDAICVLDTYRTDPKHKDEYAQFGMCATTVGVLGGDCRDADRIGKETYQAVQKYQDADQETAAAWGHEEEKFFKGEPHERSMLNYYLGLAEYLRGNYNDARVFFMQSLLAAATRDEDAQDFRDDFGLGHYWLGRAYQQLGQHDNARIAFQKAGFTREHRGQQKELAALKKSRERERKEELKLEAICYQNAATGKEPVPGALDLSSGCMRTDLPDVLSGAKETAPLVARAADLEAFLDPDFQKQVNLILIVEVGVGPIKYLAGQNRERDEILPVNFKERFVDVYVDGHRAGPAFCLCDMYHQAVTRGVKTRRDRQAGKAIAKEVLRRMPYAGVLAGMWNIAADDRYVPVLPGQVQVFAARVQPGLHTISLRCSDVNGAYLPRYDVDRPFVPVGTEQETVLVMPTKENQDNAYLLQQIARATQPAK
jgi:tetratricopeptide (TPR) repeat protein